MHIGFDLPGHDKKSLHVKDLWEKGIQEAIPGKLLDVELHFLEPFEKRCCWMEHFSANWDELEHPGRCLTDDTDH